jgi:hypothetical protein
VEPTRAGSWRE